MTVRRSESSSDSRPHESAVPGTTLAIPEAPTCPTGDNSASDIRYYLVWIHTSVPWSVGVWTGEFPVIWDSLQRIVRQRGRGSRLTYRRYRGANGFVGAVLEWQRVASDLGVSLNLLNFHTADDA